MSSSGPSTVPGIGARGRSRHKAGSGLLSASAMRGSRISRIAPSRVNEWALPIIGGEQNLEYFVPRHLPRTAVRVLHRKVGRVFERRARQSQGLEARLVFDFE